MLGSEAIPPFMGIPSIVCSGTIIGVGAARNYAFGGEDVRPRYGLIEMIGKAWRGRWPSVTDS